METEKLYYVDQFIQEFPATVLSCEAGKNGYQVVLDCTAFYPEGGGQPADHGTLGSVHVTDVHEKDGVIFHTCDGPVEIGQMVNGRIDWARRFDHMQQHSGEHIISGILCADYHCDNVGFHLGAETVTIDYNADISWEQALDAERKANEVIWADQEVEIAYPDSEELAFIDYRSKKELTGQVGLIKVLSCQKFREGVRLEIICGKRALDYLGRTYDQAKAIGQQLSVKPQDTLAAVERLEAELSAAKVRMAHLEETAFEAIARENEGRGDVLLFQPAMKGDSVRKLADAVAKRAGGLAAVFAGEDGQYAYALVQADGQDISPLVKDLNKALNGRGGGRNGFAQGSVQAEETVIREFFSK